MTVCRLLTASAAALVAVALFSNPAAAHDARGWTQQLDVDLSARELAQAGRAYLVEDALDPASCEGAASRNRPPRRPGPRASCVRHARVDRSRPDRDWHCRPCGEIIEPLMVRATAS